MLKKTSSAALRGSDKVKTFWRLVSNIFKNIFLKATSRKFIYLSRKVETVDDMIDLLIIV